MLGSTSWICGLAAGSKSCGSPHTPTEHFTKVHQQQADATAIGSNDQPYASSTIPAVMGVQNCEACGQPRSRLPSAGAVRHA
jgi:hypothetical protein